jgi:hypothetical protein
MSPPAARREAGFRAPVGVDTTRASIARVYDYSLDGKDNYPVDRAALAAILEVAPGQREVSRLNRRWLHRVVRYLAGPAGIDQFLDVGAGLPTVCNTHQVAQQENRDVQVVYVDNDPLCCAHGRALLEENANTHYLYGDLLEDGTLLENEGVSRYLDPGRPVGLIVCGVLHHVDDSLDPAAVVRRYTDRLANGSFVAITSFWDPAEENRELHALAKRLESAFTEMGVGSGWYRTREQQLEYFGGLELIEPGLVGLADWWPAGPPTRPRWPEEQLILGGVGHKPLPAPPRIHPV